MQVPARNHPGVKVSLLVRKAEALGGEELEDLMNIRGAPAPLIMYPPQKFLDLLVDHYPTLNKS